MLYIIYAEDAAGSAAKRQGVRPAHLERLQHLRNESRLIIAGPTTTVNSHDPDNAEMTGSVIIAEFPSIEDAREWANNDPYCFAGVYKHVSVKPFRRTW